MKFNILGGGCTKIPPLAARGIALIRKLPDGTLWRTTHLANALESTPSSVRQWGWAIPKELTAIYRHHKLYGNPKTVKAFQKEYGV